MIDNIAFASELSSRRVVKVALNYFPEGSHVYRYGCNIGSVKRSFNPGEIILSENIEPVNLNEGDILNSRWNDKRYQSLQAEWKRRCIEYDTIAHSLPDLHLYKLDDQNNNDSWATRLSLLILPTVNCSAHVADKISNSLNLQLKDDIINVSNKNHIKIFSVPHHTGCGLDRSSSKYDTLLDYYAKLILSPNVTRVILVSLGCEDLQPSMLLDRYPQIKSKITILSIQEEGGTQASINKGVEIGIKLCTEITKKYHRRKAPYSAVRLALQCGGSDAMSGLTANPLLGLVSDFFVSQGSQSIVAETPELYGAHHNLYPRCTSLSVQSKLQKTFHRWLCGHSLDPSANPAPGNLQGGISNSIEKSLGSAQKTGCAPISDVCQYGGSNTTATSGLILMDTPGYDPVSATGQLLAGSNILLFSTGRGSCFGLNPLPTLKISSNNYIFNHYNGEIDFDASGFSDATTKVLLKQILNLIIATASGSPSSAERLGYGSNEIIFWVESGVN